MKITIISSSICLVIGLIIGAGSYYLYQKNISDKIDKSIVIETIEGNPGTIEHEKIKNNPKTVEIITISRGKGKIKTIIDKNILCPKIKKNIVSFDANLFYQNKSFFIGYNVNYQRIFFNNIVLNTGINVNHDLLKNEISGIGTKIGIGYMF